MNTKADRLIAIDALAVTLLEAEVFDEAAALFDELQGIDSLERREIVLPFVTVAEACIRAGNIHRATTSVTLARRYLHESPLWAISVDRVDAHLRFAQDRWSEALDIVSPWIQGPTTCPFEHARLLELAADILGRLGRRAESLDAAHSALDAYERLGARGRAERASTWIETHTPKPRGRPRSYAPGELTSREHQILSLVAEGKTNREIAKILTVSPATVKKHVENILSKTGAKRRAELAARLPRQT
jgi:DNA-binding CsgD family transcriptional regulator